MNISLVEGDFYTVNHYFSARIVLEEGTYFVLYNGFKKPIIGVAGSRDDSAASLQISKKVKVVITPSPLCEAASA